MLSDAPANGTAYWHALQCDVKNKAIGSALCRLACMQEQSHKPGSTRSLVQSQQALTPGMRMVPSRWRNIGIDACSLEVASKLCGIVPRQWLSDFDSLKLGLSPVSLSCTICSGCLLPVMRHTYTGSSSACNGNQRLGSEPDGHCTKLR